jgi:DNA-binding NarL/FixJ family response regulator
VTPIRVLLADDQALVRGALAAMLGLESDIEVVAQVGSGAEVVRAATAHHADVALLDVQMPGGDGLDAAAALHDALPSCRIVTRTALAVVPVRLVGVLGLLRLIESSPAVEPSAACCIML